MDEHGKPRSIVGARPGKFDSDLVEPGPQALLRDEGILLLYDGANAKQDGDPNLPGDNFASGQLLFDKQDPTLFLQRSDAYFLTPDGPYEITSQVWQRALLSRVSWSSKARGFSATAPRIPQSQLPFANRGMKNRPTDHFLLNVCFAVMACCFFWFVLFALACFCVACFCTDFGDLSPMIFYLSSAGLFTGGIIRCAGGLGSMPCHVRFCK